MPIVLSDGQMYIEMDSTNTNIPNIQFKSGDAPTEYVLVLEWTMEDNVVPIVADEKAS